MSHHPLSKIDLPLVHSPAPSSWYDQVLHIKTALQEGKIQRAQEILWRSLQASPGSSDIDTPSVQSPCNAPAFQTAETNDQGSLRPWNAAALVPFVKVLYDGDLDGKSMLSFVDLVRLRKLLEAFLDDFGTDMFLQFFDLPGATQAADFGYICWAMYDVLHQDAAAHGCGRIPKDILCRCLTQAAFSQSIDAYVEYGMFLLNGEMTPYLPRDSAFGYAMVYHAAIRHHHANALYRMAMLHGSGTFVSLNEKDAALYCEAAAAAGHIKCLHTVALAYEKGSGVFRKDPHHGFDVYCDWVKASIHQVRWQLKPWQPQVPLDDEHAMLPWPQKQEFSILYEAIQHINRDISGITTKHRQSILQLLPDEFLYLSDSACAKTLELLFLCSQWRQLSQALQQARQRRNLPSSTIFYAKLQFQGFLPCQIPQNVKQAYQVLRQMPHPDPDTEFLVAQCDEFLALHPGVSLAAVVKDDGHMMPCRVWELSASHPSIKTYRRLAKDINHWPSQLRLAVWHMGQLLRASQPNEECLQDSKDFVTAMELLQQSTRRRRVAIGQFRCLVATIEDRDSLRQALMRLPFLFPIRSRSKLIQDTSRSESRKTKISEKDNSPSKRQCISI